MSFIQTLTATLVLMLVTIPIGVSAQDSSPAAATPVASGMVEVVATGLANPRGVAFADDGSLLVALAGSGGTTASTGEQVPPPVGPFMGGSSAAVVSIADGCPVLVAGGLPSGRDAVGTVLGAADVAILDGEIYVLVAGGGASHGNPDQPNGVYRVEGDGTATLIADLGAWHRDNPVANPVDGYEPDSNAFSMIAHDGALWFVESNSAYVGTITPDGTITRIADLSDDNLVPTAITASPAGGVYIGYLTGFPFLDGTSKVSAVAPDGTVTDIWTGLSMVTGLAVAEDGTLYATEMATGDPASQEEPPFQPQTGRVVMQTSQDSLEPVVTGLNFPISLDMDPDGLLYASLPAIGADDGSGMVVSFDPAAGAIDASTLPMENPCQPLDTTGGAATPVAPATPIG